MFDRTFRTLLNDLRRHKHIVTGYDEVGHYIDIRTKHGVTYRIIMKGMK